MGKNKKKEEKQKLVAAAAPSSPPLVASSIARIHCTFPFLSIVSRRLAMAMAGYGGTEQGPPTGPGEIIKAMQADLNAQPQANASPDQIAEQIWGEPKIQAENLEVNENLEVTLTKGTV